MEELFSNLHKLEMNRSKIKLKKWQGEDVSTFKIFGHFRNRKTYSFNLSKLKSFPTVGEGACWPVLGLEGGDGFGEGGGA